MYLNSEFLELLEELDSAIEETDDKVFLNSLVDELSEYDYAFIDKNGEELSEKDAMQAVVQSPEQLEQLGKGVCTDFVEFTCAKLDDRQISYEVYYIQCIDEDGDKPAHVFVVVEDNSKFFWVEASWKSEAGVHEYDSLESLFEDIAKKHSIYDNHNYLDSCDIRKIKKSLVGMSQKQIYQYTNSLPITWKAAEEGITESLQQIDYLPVSDVELFKEYADDILDGYGNMSDADIKSTIKEIKFEGRLAGYIGFSEYEEDGHKCLGIGNFMIIERGKGLGSAVIQNIVEKYKNQYDLIYCFVDAKNDGAIRLYKKLGKVYDEDGPNNNGEYYVTFWDNGKWELNEGKKNKKVVAISSTPEINLDSFLREIGLVPISEIASGCSSISPAGAFIWAPAEPSTGGTYAKAIPQFDLICKNRLSKLVATLDNNEYPAKIFSTASIQNNGDRKLMEVRIGEVNNCPCRGLWFRAKTNDKRYFIFGDIFYKNTQKINAGSSREVTFANKFYDAVMKKLGTR